ncbi:hypothetical protein [Nonomuraea sp. NPDC048916]|uniref:hypothetical protein n=1 Tax=Nonomuraea sp. NPDC048916 TaxID=3154232 RepID=UPI0033D03117
MSANNPTPTPSPDMRSLDRLVGTWELTGDSTGTVRYEWMEGGFFLLQHIDMHLFGSSVKALEVIGHLQPFGEPPSPEVRSRAYDTRGNTLDYVYELDGDSLTIWGGEPGSSSYYKGTFVDDDTNVGEWTFPGGGYTSTMHRVAP